MRKVSIIVSSLLTLGTAAPTPSNSSFGLTARHGLVENVPRVPGLPLSGGRDNDRDRDWWQTEGERFDDRYENRGLNDRYNDNRYQDRDRNSNRDRYGGRDNVDHNNDRDQYDQREGFDSRDRYYDRFDDNNNRDRYNDRDGYEYRDRYNQESFDNRFYERDDHDYQDRYHDRNGWHRDGVDELFPHLSPPCSALLNPLHTELLQDSSSLRVKRARARTSATVSGLNSFTVTSCRAAEEGALNLEMVFNELTISTGGRGAEARHVLDSTNRRDDIVLEGERGRFSLDDGRDRITVQVYSVPLSYHYISPRLSGRGQSDSTVRLRDRSLKYRVDLMPPNNRDERLARALFAEVQEDLEEQLKELLALIISRIRLTATRSLQQSRFKRSVRGHLGSRQRAKGGKEARREARRRERQSRRFQTKHTGCSCRMRRDAAEVRLAKISGSSRREERVEARRSRRLQSKGRGGSRKIKSRRCSCKDGKRRRQRPIQPLTQSDAFYL